MTTRLLASIWLGLAAFTSGVAAQDDAGRAPVGISTEDIVGPQPAVQGHSCFMLVDEPDYCVFPDGPRVINHSVPLNVIDLNGAWIGPGGERPYIYVYNQPGSGAGYTIAVDLSLLNRPDGFGAFVNGSALQIVFPDDRDYTAAIAPDGRTLYWSNNTVWTKL